MEVIKTSSNVEFDVIYADGTRKRVALRPEAFDFAKQFFAPMLSALTTGHGVRSLLMDAPNIVAIARADHDILHQAGDARRQAIFRLGQMDMQQSVVDMLTAQADSIFGVVRATLLDAAERVRQMEVLK